MKTEEVSLLLHAAADVLEHGAAHRVEYRVTECGLMALDQETKGVWDVGAMTQMLREMSVDYRALSPKGEPPAPDPVKTVIMHTERPHKCPVCDGDGNVITQHLGITRKCHACKGEGVLWR